MDPTICENCESVIYKEQEKYEIEGYDIIWCEDCLMRHLDGPQDDDPVDDLAEELAEMI
jgi:hypothetical protein